MWTWSWCRLKQVLQWKSHLKPSTDTNLGLLLVSNYTLGHLWNVKCIIQKIALKTASKWSSDDYFRLLWVSTFTFGFNFRYPSSSKWYSHFPENGVKTKHWHNFPTNFAIKFHFRFHFQKSSSDILCTLVRTHLYPLPTIMRSCDVMQAQVVPIQNTRRVYDDRPVLAQNTQGRNSSLFQEGVQLGKIFRVW